MKDMAPNTNYSVTLEGNEQTKNYPIILNTEIY